jgi:hypothetical protein
MKQWLKKNVLWIGLLGSLASITGLDIFGVINILSPIFSWFWSLVSGSWAHLTSSISIPCGIFYLIILLFVLLLGSLIPKRVKNLRSSSISEHVISPFDYKEDTFLDMYWRWRYVDSRNLIPFMPKAFCPKCDMELVLDETASIGRRTVYQCEKCNIGYK